MLGGIWGQIFTLYKALEVVLQSTQSREDDELELDENWIREKRV